MSSIGNIEYLVKSEHGEKVYFDDPVVVKSSHHQVVFTCYGVWVHGVNGVWLLDGNKVWHGPLKETQAHAPLIIACVYQRLKDFCHAKKVQPPG